MPLPQEISSDTEQVKPVSSWTSACLQLIKYTWESQGV